MSEVQGNKLDDKPTAWEICGHSFTLCKSIRGAFFIVFSGQ